MINILYLHAGAELYGADIVLLELLKGIDKSKFNPFVILPCDGELVTKLRENNINVEIIRYPILRRKYFNIKGIIKYISDFNRSVKVIKQFCIENKIDLIHSNTSAVLEGAFISKKLGIKHVWHIHEIIVRPRLIYKLLCNLISKYSSLTVCVSNAVERHLESSGYFKSKKIKVIYNGVDNNKFNPENPCNYLRNEFQISKDEVVVGMIGRINSWKGQEDFVAAMEKVISMNHNVKAVMVGGVFQGEEWRMIKLRNIINDSKFKDNIIVSDYRSDTANLYNLFDIFVLPSTLPDPLPTVVLEAMASRKPIVAYRHGGVTEMVIENYNGLFADVRDTDDLADKILMLINDTELMKTLAINSLNRQKSEFSTTNYINNFEKIYLNLQDSINKK